MTRSRHLWARLAPLGTVVALLLGVLSLQAATGAPAQAATSQFHGVNWADPDDNFITGPNVPVGLSTADDYHTTYTKATAILKGFQGLGANTVRMGINAATTSSSWWNSVTGAYDAADALGMNVVIAPWLQGGRVSDTTAFYQMWDTVINKYGGDDHFYFDIFNEPNGYNATDLTNFEAGWLARYPNLPRGHVIVPGTSSDNDLCAVGKDSRFDGTLLSIHIYSMFGDSHNTEADWANDFQNHLCGFADRAVVTEFGVPLTTGVNYNAPPNGDRDLSYLYGITDTVRNLGIGSIVWTGVKLPSQTDGPGPCENASCAVTSLNGTGTNLSLSVTNQSGLDRLQWGWGTGSNPGAGHGNSATGALRGTGSGRCLDVPKAATANGTLLSVWDCDSGANQQWTLLADGALEVYGTKCLDVPNKSTTPGTQVEIWDCNGGTNQQWTVNSGGSLVSRQSGLCLDVAAPGTANSTPVQIWNCNGGTNQQWTAPHPRSGPVASAVAGKCVDDNAASTANGARVQIWDCNNTAAQRVGVPGDGTLQIQGRCLDATANGTANGTLVELWGCTGGANQQWTYATGTRELVNPASGRCLDIPGGAAAANGTQLELWDCNGAANQQWSLPS